MRAGRLCFVALLLAAISAPIPAREFTTFDVVGDSISAGVNPSFYSSMQAYGWVQMLFGEGGGTLPTPMTNTLQTLWPGITQYNSAISGSKASDWAPVNSSYMTTVLNHHPDLVVVMIGGNDYLADIADGTFTSAEVAAYRTNLETIIDRLRANTPRPQLILVDYYDLADGYSANVPALYSQYRAFSPGTVQANQVIHDVAEQKGTELVSIYDSFFHHAYGGALGDTGHLSPDYFRMPITSLDIHPITVGHQVIYQLVYAKLQSLKDERLAAHSWELYQ
jgi:lysophospholipase L1-like esterase